MEIREIAFHYGEKPFIEQLSGTIRRGKITTILGPNGSGKSTLLSLLVNQLAPKSGAVVLDGKELSAYRTKDIAKKMAIVHQQNSAPSDLTVERLVSYGRSPYQAFFSAKDDAEEQVVAWALKVTNLEHMAKKKISELSGGERQRAWIAMALAQKTEILFLDEPTTYLDIYYQLEILNLVRQLNQEYNMTIVMVLHDINQAIQFSDDLFIMKKGRLMYTGPSKEVITKERLKEVYDIHADIRWCEKNQCQYIMPIVAED